MSKAGEPLKPLLAPSTSRPSASWFGPGKNTTVLRDNFDITTWLAMGALAQGTAFLLLGRLSLLPAFTLILFRLLTTYLQTINILTNPNMSNIIPGKFSAQIPQPDGTFSAQPANSSIVVFHIGARTNHPMGLLAPGYKDLGGYFQSMATELDERAEEFGFLGMTSWLDAASRSSSNGNLSVGYFRTLEGLQAFAHSELHRKAWDWWNRTVKQHSHLSIYHETFEVPKGAWETIYANSHREGLASAMFKVEGSEEKWVSGVVDANKGVLRSAAGRITRGSGGENEKYGEVEYV
ncbi:unnamed protein product [Zymoseptoria tritici ST99CH_1E4]|uniref:Uncharacterized protein n=1 Tax=Zymoseptoria tritici ST99CH_1E4 TaxID=1276532 RepID=A0A2H1GY83_ZYMTR|nr:unnamed protein product [Zymoseptoria tritici ST99CH_1E4]